MFSAFAVRISRLAAHPLVFAASVVVVMAWAICGPFFLYSENWQLVINTGTTIVSFWLGFLILAAGSREARATQAKLDELIRVTDARNELMRLEDRDEAEIEQARPAAHLVEVPKPPCPFDPWSWIK